MDSGNFNMPGGFSHIYNKDEVVIPPEKSGKKVAINIILSIIVGAIGYYTMLPAFNLKDIKLYFWLGLIAFSYPVFSFFTSKALMRPEYMPYVKRSSFVPGIIICILVVFVVGGSLVSSVFFRAKDFSEIITVEEGEFTEKFSELDFDSVPMLDEQSAKKLGGRQLGELSEYVSQYEDAGYYTQINYKESPVRVTTLRYANIIKWFTNRDQGIPAYMIVDMSTQKVDVVKLKDLGMENIKYSPSEHFGRLLQRHLRFNYPTYLFEETATFEIDDTGRPYWICPRMDKTIGLFGGDDVIGVVLVDATTGECEYYDIETAKTDKNLQWIDRIYSSTLISQQYDYFGQYSGGFWNSILGQKDVKITTQGSNYIAIDDDVYMYTGVTSVTADDSIIGFILSNQRTKETTFFKQSGATEYSAQLSAEGKVQQYGYDATFPLLLNIQNEPTFFMALKDTEGLVKMYSLVNVEQFQKVVVGTKLVDCLQAYYDEMGIDRDAAADLDEHVTDIDIDGSGNQSEKITAEGVITDIRSAVLDGNTFYYIKLDKYDAYFSISAQKSNLAVILNKGDTVKLTVTTTEGRIVEASSIEQ
ncbi:MAG: CvpA family protein [Ruminococcaceae bacterium]|nr:CvpA family protein [Oscillospiraceae bacterium]